MEENKDLLNETESSVEDTEEIVEEVVVEEVIEEVEEVEEETSEETETITESKPVKSKGVLHFSIIIAIVIFASALLVFGACKLTQVAFFDNSIVGAWIVDPEYVKENSTATGDEAYKETTHEQNTFFIFTDEAVEGTTDGQKVAKLKCGTAEYLGQYIATDNEDGTKTIVVSVSYFFSGNFTQSTLKGNVFTGKELTLVDDNGNTLPMVSASLPNLTVAVPKEFKLDEKFVGEWTDGEYGYIFKFNEDGTAYIDLGGSLIIEGAYTYDDEKITIHYIQTDELEAQYSYAFDGDVLVIDGLGFTKVTETE